MGIGLFFSIQKKEKEKVAKSGNVVLTRTVFTIAPIRSEKDNVIRIVAPQIVPQLPEGEYITISDASKEFKISSKTLRKWSKENKINAIKKSNRLWLIPKRQLIKYLEQRSRAAKVG